MPDPATAHTADPAFGAMPPADWDAWLVARGRDAGFCQTTVRSRILHARRGAVSYVLCVERDGVRVAGATLNHVLPSETRATLFDYGKAWLAMRGKGDLACVEGPVLAADDKPQALADLLVQVDALAARLGVRHIQFLGKPAMADWGDDAAVAAAFRRFGYREKPWLTSVVDLTASEERLFAGFRHAARKGVRKCIEAGLRVDVVHDAGAFRRDFYDPYVASLVTRAGTLPAASTSAAWWESDTRRYYRFLVAKDSSDTVHATLGTYAFNGVATEIMSGRTLAGRTANLPAQDLLHWEAFRIHKAAGDKWFNLAGYSADPRDAKEAGIRRFKEKWGGREIAVPQFTRGDSPVAASIAGALRLIKTR